MPVRPAEEANAGESGRWNAWRFDLLVALALGALVVVHAVLNRGLPAPQIQADEGGYLGNARYLVSGYGRTGGGYFAGYSLFLTPAALFTHTPSAFYRAALFVNACLSVFSPLLALVLVRQTFRGSPRWVPLISAGMVAFAPLVFSFVGLSLSENALVPVVLAVAVLFARAARDGSLQYIGLASAMAAFAYWVSPRGLIVAVAALVALVILARELHRFLAVLGIGTIVIAVGLGLGQLFENAVKGDGRIAGVTERQSDLFPSLFDPSIWHRWLAGALGRFAYIGATSAGLTLIGLAIALRWFLGRHDAIDDAARRVRRCVGAFAFAAPVVTLVASAGAFATNPHRPQIDSWYYGRYTEAVAMPALAIGAAWLLSTSPRFRVARAALSAGASIAVAAIAVPVLDAGIPDESHLNRLNIVGLLPIQYAFHHPTLTFQLLLGAAIAVALGTLISVRAWVFGSVTVVLLASSALVIHSRYIEPGSVARARQNALADAVRVLEEHGVSAACIRLDRSGANYSTWNEFNYRFLLASSRFEISDGHNAVNCGPLVISADPDYGAAHNGARLVSVENDAPMSLWIDLAALPDSTLASVTKAGLYFPASPCVPLPGRAYKALVRVLVSYSGFGHGLSSVNLAIDLSNRVGGAPWLAASTGARSKACGRVSLAATVTDARGTTVYRRRILLPKTVMPGESVHLKTALVASPRADPTLDEPRTRVLRLELVQEGVRFFGDDSVAVATLVQPRR
ncbi:MAG TPA: hypothetical protein VL769_03695 [Acidimicrobiia bacterium]|nr:hypothetical protein [Acidimicrobiia bacterium]